MTEHASLGISDVFISASRPDERSFPNGENVMSDRSQGPVALADRLVNEHDVQGWMGGNIHHVIDFADQFHQRNGIVGDIMEIGIHHGRLFFVMAAAARGDEKCIAVDLFDNQGLNVDHSGEGSKETFLRYADTAFADTKNRLKIVEGDSMSLCLPSIMDTFDTKGVRLFSVDGGHTKFHAVNDLCIAQELIVGGGLVLLDDFFGPHWPAVTEGFFKFMETHNRRLAPLMIFENKLFLTTFSEHQTLLDGLRVRMEEIFGDEIHSKWKFAEVCGFKVLCCS